MNLENATLLKAGVTYIGGQWVAADSGAVFDVVNPADGTVLAQVPDMGAEETVRAIEAAQEAFGRWKKTTAKERAVILRKWYELILKHAADLAKILTYEQGKPLAEARTEIMFGASFVEWYAEEAKRIYGDTIPTHKKDARIFVLRQPVGVVGAITPWNFPSAMITRKVAPALAAGCSVVLKPAEDTPLSALALCVLAEEAGVPPGVLNVVTTANPPRVGDVLTSHPLVRKLSFTGSTEVGKILMAQSASTVKKVALELGGNAPFIVFESADLDKAADGAIACKFRNAGQTCVCANRIYVHDTIYDDFAARLAERVAALSVGAGTDEGVTIGPLINEAAVEKVARHVDDALDKGATLVAGGNIHNAGALFFQPTLLAGMTGDMLVHREETFGPVAGLFRFSEEDEVIRLANDTSYGLASYFYSRDLAQCFRVMESLEYGMVAVNEPVLASEAAPFGGIKESGIGREGSKYGIEDFTDLKYVLLGGLSGS